MKHFDHARTTHKARVNLEAIARFVLAADLPGESLVGEPHMSPIYGVPVEGFIPSQYGGFEVSDFIRFDCDPSYHVTDDMTAYREELEAQMLEDFKHDYPDADLSGDYWDTDECQTYEQGWFSEIDCALIRFEVWAERGGYFARLSVGYRDAPYFRAKYDETIAEVETDDLGDLWRTVRSWF